MILTIRIFSRYISIHHLYDHVVHAGYCFHSVQLVKNESILLDCSHCIVNNNRFFKYEMNKILIECGCYEITFFLSMFVYKKKKKALFTK